MAHLYTQSLGSLFVASSQSQGYDGENPTRLHEVPQKLHKLSIRTPQETRNVKVDYSLSQSDKIHRCSMELNNDNP
jgi:hypothetical protein